MRARDLRPRATLPHLPRNEALSLGLLLALAGVFVFSGDRSQFYRDGETVNSPATMALAANLSPEHGFLSFVRQKQDPNGAAQYAAYSRFPFGYVLVKLAILPFGDDFPRAIRAARTLMLAASPPPRRSHTSRSRNCSATAGSRSPDPARVLLVLPPLLQRHAPFRNEPGDRCMASVALPEYAIDRVVTGQYDDSGHLWEGEVAFGEASE